ncbi:MAG TPA: ATP-binding protein [Rhizomicrobium sp.]|jgi:signal transduction histidine kinase
MSFRNRLALFLMATLVLVQAATATFAYIYLRQQLVEQGKRELSSAMRSFSRQLDFLSQRVTQGVQVLALDYALRSAIANSDHGTELSVLRNHGHRIGASRMLLVTLNGSIAADTENDKLGNHAFPYPALLEAALQGDRGTALVTLGTGVYWIVVVPVRAPVPIGFIAAFIPLNGGLLEDIRRISSSPHAIALATQDARGRWNLASRTSGYGPELPAITNADERTSIVFRNGSESLAIVTRLPTAEASRPIAAVIDFPLEEALKSYRGLFGPMLLLLGLALIAAATGATVIVRRVARPLEALASAAQRIAAGDYSHPSLPGRTRDEIGRLAQSIAGMTGAIAEREAALTGAMEAAEQARIEAVKANDAKSQFLANMSHELRTPLNAIVGFSEMLEQQVLGPLGSARYLEYARDIRGSGQHLRALFERMLDLAQCDSKTLSIAREPILTGALIREALAMHRGLAQRAGVTLMAMPGLDAAQVLGDASRLRQTFGILIHNAIKFTPRGGTLTISGRIEGSQVAIEFADTGTGIEPELLGSVIQPFRRLRSALDGEHQGAGLGLAFANAVVKLHGGSLSVASTVGRGTRVTIELPLARSAVDHAA